MASADQLKALLDPFVERDDQRFFSVAMQVAAHEARLGHGKLAEELRAAVDAAKRRRGAGVASPVPIARPRGELAGLLAVSYPGNRLAHPRARAGPAAAHEWRTKHSPLSPHRRSARPALSIHAARARRARPARKSPPRDRH